MNRHAGRGPGSAREAGRILAARPAQFCAVRGLGVLAAGMALVTLSALWAVPGGASSAERCDPAPKTAASFCVTYGATLPGPLDAAAPAGVAFSLANTSDQHLTDQSQWVNTVTLTLLSSPAGSAPGVLTPSDQLPDGLVIAGDDGCGPDASGSFASCGAGSGTFVADVTGTPGGLFDGFYTGHAGILRVLNVAGTTGDAVHYQADIQVCIAIIAPVDFGNCAINAQATYDLAGAPGTAGTLTLQVLTQGSQVVSGCGCTLSYTGTIDQATVHLQGTSDQVDNGAGPVPALRTYTTMRLPAACGTATARAAVASFEATPRAVTFTQSAAITGCPRARFTADLDGSAVTFDGSGSSTPLAGRRIAGWMWTFEDGAAAATATPTITHRYPASPASPPGYTVTLRVADSQGALSKPVRITIHGTATSFTLARTASKIKAAGSVRPGRGGQHVAVTLLRRSGGTFHVLARHAVTLTAASDFTTTFARPGSGTCRITARYPGDRGHLASQLTRTFAC